MTITAMEIVSTIRQEAPASLPKTAQSCGDGGPKLGLIQKISSVNLAHQLQLINFQLK